jgi:hypothetical protein
MDRRHFFQSSALVSTGTLLGCATPGIGQQKPKTPFDLPQIYIPVVGSDEMFPVRRIYCIGRSHAAHAREMGSDPTREPRFFKNLLMPFNTWPRERWQITPIPH